MADDAELLAEQVAYYRARAPEYDRWWHKTHQYELAADEKRRWDTEVGALEAWVDGLGLDGDVLELACGTGLWTRRLARRAAHLTAVDAAPEAIALNRARDGHDRVEFVEADVFEWRPRRSYDAVFFSFWLSHVPPSRWDGFWASVASALRPGGRAVFVDNRWSAHTWPPERPDGYRQERSDLSDGRSFAIVKRYWEPAELAALLAAAGWRVDVRSTQRWFVYGIATADGPVPPLR